MSNFRPGSETQDSVQADAARRWGGEWLTMYSTSSMCGEQRNRMARAELSSARNTGKIVVRAAAFPSWCWKVSLRSRHGELIGGGALGPVSRPGGLGRWWPVACQSSHHRRVSLGTATSYPAVDLFLPTSPSFEACSRAIRFGLLTNCRSFVLTTSPSL